MKIKKHFYLVTSVIFFSILGLAHSWNSTAFAEEGGAVVTDGEIIFYEVATEEPPPTSSSSGRQPATVVKPKGKLPSTGELIKKSLGITGGALILFVAVFFFLNRKKEQGREGKGHE